MPSANMEYSEDAVSAVFCSDFCSGLLCFRECSSDTVNNTAVASAVVHHLKHFHFLITPYSRKVSPVLTEKYRD